MSTIRKIALISTLATVLAGPAFALDQDTAATTINSGRYFGQQQHELQRDFQLEGRGLGE